MKRLLHPLSPTTGATQFENAPENYIDPTFSATVITWQKQH
ncbi:A/G-specific adenine glycosylase, partial [Streptococcus danieliae]|nr:A/G-specific adenine glycosylase [Streptococcus danieliae]